MSSTEVRGETSQKLAFELGKTFLFLDLLTLRHPLFLLSISSTFKHLLSLSPLSFLQLICARGDQKNPSSLYHPIIKTPTDDSSSPLTSQSAPTSPLVFIFMAPLPLLNDSSSFISKLSPRGNEGIEDVPLEAGRQPLCTTCFTCEASGGLQSIIMISSSVGARGRARTWYGLS